MIACPFCGIAVQDHQTHCEICGTQIRRIPAQASGYQPYSQQSPQQPYQRQNPQSQQSYLSQQQMQQSYPQQYSQQYPQQQLPTQPQNRQVGNQQAFNADYPVPGMAGLTPQNAYLSGMDYGIAPGVNQPVAPYGSASAMSSLLAPLSSRIRALGICWLVIGCLQLLAVLSMYKTSYIYWLNSEYLLILTVIAVINIVSSIRDIVFSKRMMSDPTGIIKRYKVPIIALVVVAVYNAMWALLPALLIIINFSIRSYIVNNEEAIEKLEQQYLASH